MVEHRNRKYIVRQISTDERKVADRLGFLFARGAGRKSESMCCINHGRPFFSLPTRRQSCQQPRNGCMTVDKVVVPVF